MGLVLVLAALLTVPMPATPQGSCIENCPVFSSTTPLSFTISENGGSGEVIAIMPTATDADQDDEHLIYSLWDRDDPIVNGDRNDAGFGDGDAEAFDFEEEYDYENEELKVRLILKTNAAYDFETKREYRFRLVACDNDFNRVYIDITVRINDVNEQLGRPDAPMVEGVSTMKLVVRWTTPDNTGLPITDYDLEYRRKNPVGDWRSWSHNGPQTNAVIMSSGLLPNTDYEVRVLARNAGGASNWSLPGTGRTKAASGNPPVFLESLPERSFPENTPSGRNIGGPVKAEGESSLTYSLEGTDAGSFDIVSSSGQIRTKAGVTYDYEAKNTYGVTVKATDSNMNSATIDVTISLTNVNEPPERPAAPVVSTASDTSLSVSWTGREYTDRPPITSYDLQYRRGTSGSWTDGPQDVPHTTLNRTITDLEMNTQYQVQVRATNEEGDSPWSPPGSGRTNVTGNDPPVFPSPPPDLEFDESEGNQPKSVMDVGAPITADDPGDTLSYTLEGADAGSFTIDSSTGQIKTRSRVYDYEAEAPDYSYSVAVKATDPHHISDTIALTIRLNDVAEPPLAPRAPSVSGYSTKSLSVSWNPPADNRGRPEIKSYDLQYRQGTDGTWLDGPQDVTDTSTTIQDVTPPLSPDTQYQVQVRATNKHQNSDVDGPWSPPGSGRTLKPPTFPAGPMTRTFSETEGKEELASRNIGAPVRATFAGGTLMYTLEGPDAGSFTIDAGTGQIKTKLGEIYDYEAQPPVYPYSVTVKASDPSNVSATTTVTINITPVTERPLAPGTPVVTSSTTMSLTVEWTEPDNTGRPPITNYDLQYRQGTSGSWRNGPQDVIGTSTTIDNLDPETLYQIRVRATNDDGDGPYSEPGPGSTSGDTPVNNTPPTFPATSTTREFPEDTPANRPIGDPVMATDADVTDPDKNDMLTYSLGGTDAASFKIDFGTGQLRTKPGVTYDYETKPSYMVTVRVADSSNATASISVAIHVTNVDEGGTTGPGGNRRPARSPSDDDGASSKDDKGPSIGDAKPTFPDDAATRSLKENTEPGLNIGAPVTATVVVGGPLAYALGGADAASFDIDSSTGQLRTKAGVIYDYETKNSYAVTVTATGSSKASASIPVTINVDDVDEKPATPEAPTVSAPDGSSTSLMATWTEPDRNGGPPISGYRVEYRQGTSGARKDWPHSGTGTTATILGLRPHTEYQVRVQALNGELPSDWSPPGSGRTNNAAPVFADSATTRSFPENTPPGHNISPPVAAEDVEGEPLTYALEGADATSFDIEPATGQLKTKSGVSYDHETRPSYSVTVRATDPHDASDVIVVIINVTNVPEKPATPAAPTVSAPDGSTTTLLATWTPPDLSGGPPLTGYDVQYRQGTDGVWTNWPHTGTDTTTTITQLAAGTDYQVQVRALGEIPSDWSPPASGRTGNVTVNDWVERFGRSIAQQMIEGVQDRLASPCRTGLQGALAGYRFDGDGRGRAGLLERPWIADDAAAMRLGARDPVSAMGPALLAGTEFELAGETTGGGITCVWGRGAYSSFHGREGQFSLDGNVTTGTLGADYQSGSWTVGVALSHSRGEGRDSSRDDIEAALTGFFPYAGYQITKRLSIWGLGGFGRGGLTVTPPNGTAKETDMGLLMIAAGARSLLLTAPRGMNVAFETDGFWVHAASDGTSGLSATKSDANRLRFGLESSYRVVLKYGGTLTPRFEIGWRYDGGGAETGLGVDIGGGLVWWAPAGGITAEIEVRRVLMHEATGFNDWNVSGLVRYDPSPFSERGASVALRSSIGPPSFGTANSLLERDTLAGLASSNTSGRGQLTAEAAYGFPILGGRFTGAPWVGMGLLESGRDYRVGYRISPVGQFGSHMQVGIEGMRRENDYGEAVTEHAIGLRLALGW